MVQLGGKLSLRPFKGKQYLHLIGPQDVDLSSQGFTPVFERGEICWQRIFRPGLVEELQNHLGPMELSPELRDLAVRHEILNVVGFSADAISNDAIADDFQKEATVFVGSKKRAFLALAPGLGKTLSSLRAMEGAGYKFIMVVAPGSLLRNWRKEIERWLPDSRVMILEREQKTITGPTKVNRLIALTNYEGFSYWYEQLAARKPGLIIFDESILLKNRDTVRYRGRPEKKVKNSERILPKVVGVKEVLKDYKGSVWMLTGGPTSRFYDDLYGQLYLLNPKRFTSYWQFTERYCFVKKDQWGAKVVGNRPEAADLLAKDLSDIYFARTQDQVKQLPPFIFEPTEIEMSEEQAELYTKMEKEFFVTLPSGDEVAANNVLTQILRLTQLASNAHLLEDSGVVPISSTKWEAVASLLEFVQKPVLIWTNFLRTASLLGTRLSRLRVATLTGEVSVAERQGVVDAFQSGELDVLIAHPAVGKYGHTLTKARTAIYVERSYNGDDYYQSLYRIRRIGTKESPVVYHLLSTNRGQRTVDHAIDAILRYRHDNNVDLITARVLRQAWAGELP